MPRSNAYTVGFAAAICLVCSIFVSGSAVALKERQDINRTLDRQKKVLQVAGLMEEGEKLTPEQIQSTYDERIVPKAIDMKTGAPVDDVDLATYDMEKYSKDPDTSYAVEENVAKVKRLPNDALVYEVRNDSGGVDQVIIPIQGPGLWSTLMGYVALSTDDHNTIKGLTFYKHAETPGLGGEVDNPGWKAKWPGRKVFGPNGDVAIKVIKGAAGTTAEAPHAVDGLSGATLTSNGVTKSLQFWLGDEGFGPYIAQAKGK
ncbi:MAG: Na(+)-translocating NADH-quinone reductase subunit C [Deltaproteobacteria bacterium]|nr:Na(+)-translocating NADH-quinone reductase subunit C [Deltaproteobacteria bacterium]